MWEFNIAKKIHFNNDNGRLSEKPAVVIATIGIALGLAVMIIAIGVVVGFKQEVKSKVIGFGSHIQITALSNNSTYQMEPVSFSDSVVNIIKSVPGVKHIQYFATKPAILKTKTNFNGVVLKGWDKDADSGFFSENLIEGRMPDFTDTIPTNDIIISDKTAKALDINVGDSIPAFFIEEKIRARKFTISGIYSTGMEEFDKLFVIGDIRHCQALNNWESDEYCGMELLVDDFKYVEYIADEVGFATSGILDSHGTLYYVRSIGEVYPQIFSWLDLLDMNAVIILVLMLLVSGFNMISGLLILILDKTQFIGVLKALGSRNWSIRKIFLTQSLFLILKGLVWGNIIGIGLCLLQIYFHIIPLDASIYFVSYVPIVLNVWHILGLNILSAVTAMLMLLLPSAVISRIVPARAIKFE